MTLDLFKSFLTKKKKEISLEHNQHSAWLVKQGAFVYMCTILERGQQETVEQSVWKH